MAYGVPFMLLGIPACWWVLTRWTLRFDLPSLSRERIRDALGDPGPLTGPEWRVLAVVGVVAAAWVFQPVLQTAFPKITDAGIAVAGALLVCILPSGQRDAQGQSIPLLDWGEARRAPWYLILLLGGGLALADAVVKSGLSAWLGTALEAVSGLPVWSMILAIALMCALITEAASNVATATIFMPIAASLALGAGYDPVIAALAAAMAANLGFANPAATSSNALVYSTGQVPIAGMIRTGLIFDVIGAVLITVLVLTVIPWLGLS
jgi:sodium-dependent dicarboxylate transporter 2/3/5